MAATQQHGMMMVCFFFYHFLLTKLSVASYYHLDNGGDMTMWGEDIDDYQPPQCGDATMCDDGMFFYITYYPFLLTKLSFILSSFLLAPQ